VTADRQPVDLATTGPPGEPDLLFVHASSFCKEIWHPIARRLAARHPGLVWRSIDIRGHGDSPTGAPPYEWDLLAADVVKTIGHTKPMVGVGHSVGGALVARAAIEDPDRFHALVLIEPIIFPPPHSRLDPPLAVSAERRRVVFPSRKATYDAFAKRSFRTWDRETLAAYVDYGFEDAAHGWSLKCSPQVEADVYREGSNHDTWEHVSELELPVTIIVGAESDTHRDPYVGELVSQFFNARVVVVEQAGHFVPMEKPQVVADVISVTLGSR